MKSETEILMYLEENETKYVRNCRVYDTVDEQQHAYIVLEQEDEYKMKVFRGFAFNFDDALRIAKDKLIAKSARLGHEYWVKWLLVEDKDKKEAWGLPCGFMDTSYLICCYGDDGEIIDSMHLFGVTEYTDTTNALMEQEKQNE